MSPDVAILRRWLAGRAPHPTACDRLVAGLDRERRRAWDIALGTEIDCLRARAQDLQGVYPQLQAVAAVVPDDRRLQLAWELWLPLARKIARRAQQQQPRPLIWGILGLQGTGKTTLASILQVILSAWGYSVLCLSIDDLYKTYCDRQALQKTDPRLIWRGPPGTHDVDLGLEMLAQIRARRAPLAIPRFDKTCFAGAGDRIAPQVIPTPVDILLFEGWFLGVRPLPAAAFDRPPPPIVTAADRQFARDCNARLAAYLPLWDRLDALVALYPEDYRHSLRWRQEAEARARAAGKGGMSDREVAAFVAYFWRALHPELFVSPLLAAGARLDLTIALDARRHPLRIYAPA